MSLTASIYETSLYVTDLEISANFYKKLFEFETLAEGDRLIALNVCNKQVLLLFKKGASGKLEKGAHDANGVIHIAFSINKEDFFKWKEKLKSHNISIEDERKWEPGGTSIYFRDPDGHLVELAMLPVW